MKHISAIRIFSLFITSVLFLLCCTTRSENKEFIGKQHTVPAHPRILWLPQDEALIKRNISDDSVWNAIHLVIIHESDLMLSKPLVEYELEGQRLLEKSRELRKRIFYFGYAWRMTHDKKYLNRAEKELLNVSDFPDWNPSHFLDVAEMTWGAAIGYDWLYHDLSDVSRKKIKEAILQKGINPSFKSENNSWLKEDNNWNQVCNASMLWGALAIYDDEPVLARKVINRSIESIQLPMKVYDPDGAYPEGYQYWSYGTTFNVYLINALERAFEDDFGLLGNSGFFKTAGYITNMVGPTGLNFNYSDGPSKSMFNPVMFWFAGRMKDKSLLASEKLLMGNKSDLPWQKDLPAVMIWGVNSGPMNIPDPQQLIWVGQGKNPVALMRSSWDSDAIYVGLKGGSPYNNHGHMDVGSFVLDALGERWVMDFGSQSYNSLESKGINLWSYSQESQRWNVFRYNNLAHNTLAFNNEFQLVEGYSPITNFTSGKSFLSATTDLTTIYKNHVLKVLRGVAIINGEYAAIRDEIELNNMAATTRWTMLTSATVNITGKNTAEFLLNNKKIVIRVDEPKEVELVTWSTQSTHDYDEPNPGTTFVGFELKTKPNEKIGITVLLIPINDTETHFQKVPSLDRWKEHK